MNRHSKRRSLAPSLQALERRRLLTFTATWIGQDGSDFVGTESSLLLQSPNDYQDIRLRLSGLAFPNDAVTRVRVDKFGGGGWSWDAVGKKGALFLPDEADPTAGDIFMEPMAADPAGTWYEKIRVDYASGAFEETHLNTGAAVDPNLRVDGARLGAEFQGQTDQDWTGPFISVGPDGIRDVRVDLSNLSAGADVESVRLTATSPDGPTRVWEAGLNPNGHWNAELLNRPGQNGTLGATAEFYFSPDVDLDGYTLKFEIVYAHRNPDGSYTNRSGKTDVVIIAAGATNPNAAMPVVAEANLPATTAASLPQLEAFPGHSRVMLDPAALASLPSPQSLATVRSAVLTNLHGSTWVYTKSGAPAPHAGDSNPIAMVYEPSAGVFGFPPVRDEDGSTLTLLLTFDDGALAVARFTGAASDINRRALDSRAGAPVQEVHNAAELLARIGDKSSNIHMKAGVYALADPLSLDYPVRITADPGAALVFALSKDSGSAWNTASGAIRITSSHVALDGFAVRFEGNSSLWTARDRFIIQAGGGSKVGLSLTRLDIEAPAAASSSSHEVAINLMNFEGRNAGRIADNILKGGYIQLGVGPWAVVDNDYRGAVANTVAPSFLNATTSHDITIRGNHAHAVAPSGITRRFLVFGRSDLGQGIGNVIENNIIDGGLGTPASNPTNLFDNAPEIILMETYQPRFEGRPSSVSPDGLIVQIPHLRGPAARTGDVVSILTGPRAGEWRRIVQALGPTRYLLDAPLPQGDFVIAIGRGFVDQTLRGNTIDLRGMSAGNVAVLLPGNQWGTKIVDNAFLGGNGIDIHAGSNEKAFETPGVGQRAPWGWSRLPIFDLLIDGNAFVDAPILLSVAHGQKNKVNAGRSYFTGVFSNNRIEWSIPNRPAVTIGVGARLVDNSDKRIPLDFNRTNYPWITPDEIRLVTRNNWGFDASTGGGPTMKVHAASLDGVAVDDQTIVLNASPIIRAFSNGQDGSDLVGLGAKSNGPDGYQDLRVTLNGLHPGKAIDRVVVTAFEGGEWRYNDPSGGDAAALFRDGTTAELYIQPRRNEAGGAFTVVVFYADGTWVKSFVSPVFAIAGLPVLPEPLDPESPSPRLAVVDPENPTTDEPPQLQPAALLIEPRGVEGTPPPAPQAAQPQPVEPPLDFVQEVAGWEPESIRPPALPGAMRAGLRPPRALPAPASIRLASPTPGGPRGLLAARQPGDRRAALAAPAPPRRVVPAPRGQRVPSGRGAAEVRALTLAKRLAAAPAGVSSEPIRLGFRLGNGGATLYSGMRDRGGR